MLGKPQRNRPADSAARAGNCRHSAVEPEAGRCVALQSDTPRFQGMKSSCALISALVRTSPLAT
jgi:shikimate kinase